MIELRRLRAYATGEEGGVLVLVVLFMPVLILFATFVVDVGNWFEHKRHLQVQADAGALGGAGLFTVPCSNAPIVAQARKYAGDPADGGSYNRQIGGIDQTNVHILINSSAYWNEGGTDYSDGGQPCEARTLDLKITEANLPWFFGLNVVPAVNSHARVEIRGISSTGALPVAVPEIHPLRGKVTFINADTGAVIASTMITEKAFTNGVAVWDNSEAPLPVTVNVERIGVRVTLSGSTSTTCGEPLVACYDLGSSSGILSARGWSASGSGAQPNNPILRTATLFPGSCSDPYFSSSSSTCTVGVRAALDVGSLATTNVQLKAVVGGTEYAMTYEAASGTWVSSAVIPVAPGAGPVPIDIKWQEITGSITGKGTCSLTFRNNNPCQGTFTDVQRAFGGSEDRSGPINVAQIWENGSFWANSFQLGTTHNLVVKIGVRGNLENASSVNDPVVQLRVTGSQNQSVDCDPDLSNLRSEIANGCTPLYTRNTGTACPATASDLWGLPEPWSCVAVQTGGAVGQVEHGMQDRILGGSNTCTSPNNWSQFPNIPGNDPRIVPVFLTPFGTFQGTGNEIVPVSGFATFYVTGWFGSPCAGDDPVTDRGYIVGHFIKYIYTLNERGGSEELCDFNTIGSCVAVLVE